MVNQNQSVSDSVQVNENIVNLKPGGSGIAVQENISDNISISDSIGAVKATSGSKLAKVFIDTFNSSGALVNTRLVKCISAQVTLNWERAVDTGTFTFPISAPVNQGNVVKYIQDVADVTYLYGIWNFQDNLFDEAGYNLDGAVSGGASYVGSTERFLSLTGTPDTISDNSVMFFQAMFDWMIWIKGATTTSAVTILSKADSTTGLEIGIAAGATGYAQVDCWIGGVHQSITGTHVQVNDGGRHWIRVKRDENNVLSLYVDGTFEGHIQANGDLTNRSTNLIFGTNNAVSAGTKNYTGYLAQIRMYCGGYLSDQDAHTVITSRRQPLTMKHAGVVWQLTNDIATTTVQTNGWGTALQNITTNVLSNTQLFTSRTASYIVQQIVNNYLQFAPYSFSYADAGSNLPSYSTIAYMLNGTMLSNLQTLIIMGQASFYVNARQLLTTEPRTIDFSSYLIYDYLKYKITDNGQDNTNICNSLTSYVNSDLVNQTDTFTPNGTNPITLSHIPLIFTSLTVNGVLQTAGQYSVNFLTGVVTPVGVNWGTNANSWVAVYEYAGQNNGAFQSSDSSSQGLNGLFARTITVSGLFAVQQPLKDFTNNFVTKYKNVNHRYTIEAPFLINSIRPNYQVTVNNPILNLNSQALVVCAITWYYPEAQTDIIVGDYIYDSFDLSFQAVQNISGITNAYIQQKTT